MNRPGAPPSHRQVADYCAGTASASDRTLVEWFRENDAVWALFFRTLESLLRLSGLRPGSAGPQATGPIPLRSEMDSLFERVCAGAISKTDSDRLISSLLASPVFFERWLIFLSEVEPDRILKPSPETAAVRMQPDEILLRRLTGERGRRRLPLFRGLPDGSKRADQAGRHIDEFVRSLSGSRKWAVSLAVIAVLTLSAVIARRVSIPGRSVGTFVFDDRVPFEYDADSFRGAPAGSDLDPEIEAWTSAIRLGLSDYLLRDYRGAVAAFREADNTKPSAVVRSDSMRIWERDLSFYSGLSHLALWRTRTGKMEAAERSLHADLALRYLARADSVVQAARLEDDGREAYFIGLIYSLQGRDRESAEWLGRIEPGGIFHEKAVLLMKRRR